MRSARASVAGEDHRRQSVGGRVGQGDRVGLVGEGLEGQDRSEDLALDDLGVVARGLDERGLVPEAIGREPIAAEDDAVARRARARSTKPSTRARCSGWISGEMVVAGSRLSPRTWRFVSAVKRSRNSSRTDVLDEETRAGEADLARVVVHQGRLGGREVEVRVGEDDERTLAPELGGEGREVLGRRNADGAPGLGRPGEGDATHARVAHEGGAHLLAEALDQVEHPRRKPRLVDEVHQERAAERRPLGGLQDNGVARGEGRRALPRREHERGVPRRDHDRRARRHAQDGVVRAVRVPPARRRSARRGRRRRGSCARRAR